MTQLVSIECDECKSILWYKFDGCIVIGYREDPPGLFYKAHEVSLGDIIKELIDELVKMSSEKGEKGGEKR